MTTQTYGEEGIAMARSSRRSSRGRALLVLLLALAASLALAAIRRDLGSTAGLAPAETMLVAVAEWIVWLVAGYVVAVVGVASLLAMVGRPSRANQALLAIPALLRPALGAALGAALTASPVSAATPPPSPTTTTADPFAWSAPIDAAARIDAAAVVAPAADSSAPRRAPPRATATRTVRVSVGDCLWSLAARDLAARHVGSRPADIALAWHRWYAANRAVIGPDPGLLHPGEVLRVPPLRQPSNPSNRIIRRPS
jgi:hypothetical protein